MTALRLAVRAQPDHPVWQALADLRDRFTVVDDDDSCDAAFVTGGGVGGDGDLPADGVHVLAQPPVAGRAVASALRAARRAGVHFALLDLTATTDPLVALADTRLGPDGIAEVEATTPPAGLHTTLRALHGVLPSLRPWRLVPRTPALATGTVGDCMVTIALRPENPADLTPHRILVRGPRGTAIAAEGTLTWLPGPFGGPAEIVGTLPAPVDALRARLTEFHTAITTRQPRDPRADQLTLTVSRLAEDLGTALTGTRPPPPFPPEAPETAHRAALAHVGDPTPAVAATQDLERTALTAMAAVLANACGDGQARTPDEILAAAQATPGLTWLIRRWIAVLVEEGRFEAVGDRIRPLPPAPHPADLAASYTALGFPPPVADFHQTVRTRLPALVRGEESLSALMFPAGDTTIAEALYGEGWANRYLNTAAATAVHAALAGTPGTPTVLELGAGVGATTRAILAGNHAVHYVYSDLSRLFLQSAPQHETPLCRALLDINADLLAQGAPADADVVIAGHVLHSAVHIGRTLRAVRATLREGGLLAVIESTSENHALLASIQLLRSAAGTAPRPGAGDGRAATGRMFLDREAWHAELTAAGFTVRAFLPPPGHEGAALGQALILATACRE